MDDEQVIHGGASVSEGLSDCLVVHTMHQALKGQISCLGVDHNLMGK